MKLTIKRTALLKALKSLKGSMCNLSMLPAYGCVYFNASTSGIILTAARESHMMRLELDAEKVTQHGRCAMHVNTTIDVLSSMSDQVITIGVSKEGMVELSQESFDFKHKCKVTGIEDIEFIDECFHEPDVDSAEIEAATLFKMIDRTVFCASKDDARANLMCVELAFRSGEILATTTDGHRLARMKIHAKHAISTRTSKLIPRLAAIELAKMCKGVEGSCSIAFNDAFLSASMPGSYLNIKLTDATFPDVDRMLGDRFQNRASFIVNRIAFSKATRLVMAGVSSRSKTQNIRFISSDGQISLTARVDHEVEARVVLEGATPKENFKAGFNSQYVKQAVSALRGTCDDINVSIVDTLSPSFLTPTEQIEGEELLMCVMPMRL